MKSKVNTVLRTAGMAALLGMATHAFAQNNAPAAPGPAPRPASPQAPPVVGPIQGPADSHENWAIRFFELKYANVDAMQSILQFFRADIVVPPAIYPGGGRRTISVRAPEEIMPAIADTIERFDVAPPPAPAPPATTITPRKSVEVSVQVIGAYDAAGFSACAACGIPESLQPVITQLQKNFSYKSYQLLDTQVYRQLNYTSLTSNNSLPGMNDPFAAYNISWGRVTITDEKQPIVTLNSLKFGANVNLRPANATATSTAAPFGFDDSTVEIPLGQAVVVGKTTVGSTAIILVLRAKLLD